jgi:geranylgeranyl diphosphate synthase type II
MKSKSYLKILENRLGEITSQVENETLKSAMHYALFSGGKRLRPLLLLSISGTKGLDVACAIELIHTYTLIHDDLPAMDNDDFRRGKKTLHKVFDEATAILVGDMLLTLSFEMISKAALRPTLKLKIIELVSKKIGANGLILGQHLDLLSKNKTLDEETLKLISHKKTAELFSASILAGAYIKSVNQKELEEYEIFAEEFGLYYQVKDDLEDKNSSFEITTLKNLSNSLKAKCKESLNRLNIESGFLSSCFD